MSKKFAVVTDAVSPRFMFEKWLVYYSSLFGIENIYILTYKGLAKGFRGWPVGGLIELPVAYNDEVRACFVSGFVSALLAAYTGVVRVDVDEFLVPDQRNGAPSLKTFLDGFDGPICQCVASTSSLATTRPTSTSRVPFSSRNASTPTAIRR